MKTVEDYLKLNAQLYPDKVAIVCNNESITYAELYRRVVTEKEILCHEFGSKNAFLIRTTQSIESLVQYFAIHLAGAVAVPLEGSIPQTRYDEIENIVSNENFAQNIADILFTTGTTGKSKGVMISYEAIIAEAENLISAQQFSHELVFIISGPLNHIGSLSKIYPTILVGGTLIILQGIKDIDSFFNALDYPCTKMATFLVPASIRMLCMYGAKRLSEYTDKIDFIETGAAPISQQDMERVCQLLPKTRIYNTYASTETGIIATFNFNAGECFPGCLGVAMKHSQFFITQEGTVACKGKTIMSGYVADPELTSKICKDFTIYTSDKGEIDSKGRLRLLGRNDDVINIGGYKVNPTEIENIALAHSDIQDCICISTQHPVLGNILKLLIVTIDNAPINKKSIAKHLAQNLEKYKVPQMYQQVEKINRTYNGKLDRKSYNK